VTDPTAADLPAVIPGQVTVDEVLAEVQLARGQGAPVSGELVSPLDELASTWTATLVGTPQTQATYAKAIRRFVAWAGPSAGAETLSLEALSAYHAHLARPTPDGRRRAPATIRKERSALNALIRWALEHELVDRRQGELALSVRLPHAKRAARERPTALTEHLYGRLLAAAEAQKTRDQVQGARDVAIVRVLGDAGLRCEELAHLDRRDFLPARRGARVRVLDVRLGKGARQRHVRLTPSAARSLVAWDRARTTAFGPAPADAPLFVTLGRRRRNGSYAHPGRRCHEPVLDELVKRLGRRAGIPAELRRAHVLRHTMATRWAARPGANLEVLRRQLGHADLKTTQIYMQADDELDEREVLAFDAGAIALERDAGPSSG